MRYFCLTLVAVAMLAALKGFAEEPKLTMKNYANLITAAPLPQEYEVSTQDLMEGDKKTGRQLIVVTEGSESKLAITIDLRVPKSDAEKLSFTKGYLSGNGKALAQLGMKLIDGKLPEDKMLKAGERTISRLTYLTPTNEKLYVELQVFFDKVGHNVIILADSKAQLDILSAWARTARGLKN